VISGHFLDLINNVALLLAVAFLFDLIAGRRQGKQPLLRRIAQGLIIGAIGNHRDADPLDVCARNRF
jgi:hypothetical protein